MNTARKKRSEGLIWRNFKSNVESIANYYSIRLIYKEIKMNNSKLIQSNG